MTVPERRHDDPGEPRLDVRVVDSPADMRQVIAIRTVVFIDEQHLTDNVDRDPYDQGAGAVVVLAYLDGEPVGTGRLHVWRGQGQIAWVAVLRPHRGRGVGREIMEALLDAAADLGAERVTLSAQTHAIEFYRLLGFAPVGDLFIMGNIEHITMVRDLAA